MNNFVLFLSFFFHEYPVLALAKPCSMQCMAKEISLAPPDYKILYNFVLYYTERFHFCL